MLCVMMNCDFSEYVNALPDMLFEIQPLYSIDDLIKYNGNIDLICWEKSSALSITETLSDIMLNYHSIIDAANIFMEYGNENEVYSLKSGYDEHIDLNSSEKVILERLSNAIKKKKLMLDAMEEQWKAFAYKYDVLDNALFVFDINIINGNLKELQTSDLGKNNLYPLCTYMFEKGNNSYIHRNDIKKINEILKPELLQKYIKEGKKEKTVRFRIVDLNGFWIWTECHLIIIKGQYSGNRCICIMDLINTHKIDQKIYERVCNESAFAIVTVDVENDVGRQIVLKNKKVKPVSRSYSDNYKKLLTSMMDKDDAKRAVEDFKINNIIAKLDKTSKITESYSIYIDTEVRRISCEITYFENDVNYIIIIIRDITDVFRKSMEHQRKMAETMREKNIFYAKISHDMRTPLYGVLGFTKLALTTTDVTEIKEYLVKIEQSGNLLLDLVNDSLNYNKIENNNVSVQKENIDFTKLITSIIDVLKVNANDKNIKFIYLNNSSCKINYMYTDRLMLSQIIINLCSNAIKYTLAEGTVLLQIERMEEKTEECNLHIRIQDTGIGISKEFLPKAFDPFSQDDSDNMGKMHGNGLGLAIVKGYVNLLSGHILINSEVGKGTIADVFLPVTYIDEISENEKKKKDYKCLRDKRVLISEDNKFAYEIISKFLQYKNVYTEYADNGKKAVEMFVNHENGYYDAILMDIKMPVMNGLTAASEIRKSGKTDADSIPIIATTANAFASDIEAAKNSGMNYHIAKPVKAEILYDVLEKATKK